MASVAAGGQNAVGDLAPAGDEPAGPGSPRPLIQIDGLSKVYETNSGRIHALDDVSASVDEGEIVCFVGPSGCGKSTLLSIVAGLVSYGTGTVEFRCEAVREPTREMGFMFQAPVLLPWRTVEQNVLLPSEIFGEPEDASREAAREALALVRLEEFTEAYPRELSGGMQQRVSLARLLAYKPSVLLMDEPFGALDEFTREDMNLELLRIAEAANVTVLFVTHSIPEAVFLGDRVVVMTPRPGRVAGIVEPRFDGPRELDLMQRHEFADYVFQVRALLTGDRR